MSHWQQKGVLVHRCVELMCVLMSANYIFPFKEILFHLEQQQQEHHAKNVPALTLSCSGTRFGSLLLAYMRNTLCSSTWSKIFLQSRSAALLEGAQARMWQEAWFLSICLMASTRVTVLPEQKKDHQNNSAFVREWLLGWCLNNKDQVQVIYWSLLYLFQVDQTPDKGRAWMSQLQCVVRPDTALGFSPALSQTAYQEESHSLCSSVIYIFHSKIQGHYYKHLCCNIAR